MMTALKQTWQMYLRQLLQGIVDVPDKADRLIHALSMDSRYVAAGTVFIACPGETTDGRKFIEQAVAAGAVAVLWQAEPDTIPIPVAWKQAPDGGPIPLIAITDLKQKVGVLADRFYAEPSKTLNVIGITGTNGKTSIAYYLAQLLGEQGETGFIGTLGMGTIDHILPGTHTTPDVITCHKWLAELKQRGIKNVVMEVSSHALVQGRVSAIRFTGAVFTNLSHEHLDYHGDMQEYEKAKAKLFAWPDLKYAVVNNDDEAGRNIMRRLPESVELISYGTQTIYGQPAFYAENIRAKASGLDFTLITAQDKIAMQSGLLGEFNISNILASLGVVSYYGMTAKQLADKVAALKTVKGRMQIVNTHPLVVVDYAHTPDALVNALSSLRKHCAAALWCVFGCGGDRDKDKRPLMGAAAESLATHVIVTDDNPRHEDSARIIDAILAGMKAPQNVVVQAQRKTAIEYALENAVDKDVVLIAGKGHEEYQQIGDEKNFFSDEDVVAQFYRRAN